MEGWYRKVLELSEDGGCRDRRLKNNTCCWRTGIASAQDAQWAASASSVAQWEMCNGQRRRCGEWSGVEQGGEAVCLVPLDVNWCKFILHVATFFFSPTPFCRDTVSRRCFAGQLKTLRLFLRLPL